MSFRKQPARGVGYHLAEIAVVAIVDEFLGAALRAEAERLIGDEFIGGEAVVKLDHRDIVGADAGFLIDLARGFLGHVVTDRSEEHTSELQSLMRISYAVFCLQKKTHTNKHTSKLCIHK